MKSSIRGLYSLWLVCILFSINCSAQVTATAGASVTIILPIGIEKEVDLDFGNISAGATPGTVTLQPDGQRVLTGGATFPGSPGNVTAAVFNVTGSPDYTFSITLPSTPATLANGSHLMTADSFTCNPGGSGILGPGGNCEIHVGARLHVGPVQPVGIYHSLSQFAVTVNYN